MFYICKRSLRNGALTFVKRYSNESDAQAVADLANYTHGRFGPEIRKYVVISAL